MQPIRKNKATKICGISWSHQEILDLLSIWGNPRMQEALRASHRNLDSFKQISKKMVARGHNRTAAECRNKTKTMRAKYRRVCNNQSGNAPTTCPYYYRLHRILRGDASMKPKRVVRRLESQTLVRSASVFPEQQPEVSEEHFTHELPTTNQEDITEATSMTTGDKSALGDLREECASTSSRNGEEAVNDSEEETHLPPNTRLANACRKRRKRTVTLLSNVAKRSSLQTKRKQPSLVREMETDVEERRQDHQECMHMFQEANCDRKMLHDALIRNCTALESAVDAFKMFLEQYHRPSNSS